MLKSKIAQLKEEIEKIKEERRKSYKRFCKKDKVKYRKKDEDDFVNNPMFKLIEWQILEAKLQAHQENMEMIVKEIDKLKDVKCVGMTEEFIKGSNWCNQLWIKKIEKIKAQLLGGKDEK